jgi:hypothetical protein
VSITNAVGLSETTVDMHNSTGLSETAVGMQALNTLI